MAYRRINLFGVSIDSVRMAEAVDRLYHWIDTADGMCRYVVTPNADHAVMLQQHAGLRRAYAEASLVLCDGTPVLLASRILGRPLPERVAGSDLVPALFAGAARRGGLRAYLLGAAPGVAERAAEFIAEEWPMVNVVGTCSPPLGFENDAQANQQIVARIGASRPDVLLAGLGAPKQELWLQANRNRLSVPVALGIGATIDFLAGEKARAPRWMRAVGCEWAHRLASEPRRLARRYARDAWVFPQLVFQEWRRASGGKQQRSERQRSERQNCSE